MIATGDAPRRTLPPPILWGSLICLSLLFYAFGNAEKDFLAAWQTEEYSHGPFIPFIAVLLAWHRLAESPAEVKPSWWGGACLLLAAGFQIVSLFSAFGMAGQYGLLFALVGTVFGFYGRQAAGRIAPALFYLIFAIPLPHLLQADLSQELQLLSSSLGVWPLDLLDIPAFQQGNIIDLGGYKLQVVDACSGLRYLFPLMSFGYLAAMLLEDRFWKRAVVFLSTIPISIGLNAFRITIIGVTVSQWGRQMAEGFIHDFEGWTIFLVCLCLLAGEVWALLHIGKPRGRFRYDYIGFARGRIFSGYRPKRGPALFALACAALLALFLGPHRHSFPERIPAHPPFSSFPTQLDDWSGTKDTLSPEVLAALQLSDYWLADYRQPQADAPVNLYIAYYDSQRVGVTTHSPSNCIPGGGWQIAKSSVISVPLADGTVLRASRLIIHKDKAAELVYYWFDERGRDLTEAYIAKWYLLWDSMRMNRSDGALVRLVTPLNEAGDEAQADARLNNFITGVAPVLKSFIPSAAEAKITP